MCLYPTIIQNPKFRANKGNNYNPPKCEDIRMQLIPIGCGNCIECRRQNSRQWQVRLNEEIKVTPNGNMVTLTFNDEELEKLSELATKELKIDKSEENEIAKIAVRRFLERWRKKYGKSVKHWLVTELGHTNTERIHLHGIIWTEHKDDIKNIWKYGYVTLGNGSTNYVNERTINYIVKYITKLDSDHKGYKAKILCSSGIGANYINTINSNHNKYTGKQTDESYITPTGTKLNLPIYYRNKIYTEKEREELWINKIDKGIRYICGDKVNIAANEKNYETLLTYHQRINKRLGYGDKSKEWSKEQYREERKRLKRKKGV